MSWTRFRVAGAQLALQGVAGDEIKAKKITRYGILRAQVSISAVRIMWYVRMPDTIDLTGNEMKQLFSPLL